MSKKGEGVRSGERRRNPRYELHLPIHLEYEIDGITHAEASRFIDVSVGGACIPILQRLEQGTPVIIRMRADRLAALGLGRQVTESSDIIVTSEVLRTREDPRYPESWCSGVRFQGPFRITEGGAR